MILYERQFLTIGGMIERLLKKDGRVLSSAEISSSGLFHSSSDNEVYYLVLIQR